MPPSAITLNRNTHDRVLPSSIFSLDMSPNDKRPLMFRFPYDREHNMVYLNIEDYFEMGVWVSLVELVFYARQLKINGKWATKHFDEFNVLISMIESNDEIDGETIIHDGLSNNYIPLVKFMYLHSNKYRNTGDGYFVVEREGSHVDNGCAVLNEREMVQVVDMFADGTEFFPVDDYSSLGADDFSTVETITEGDLERIDIILGDDFTITTMASTDVEEAIEDLELSVCMI